MEKEYIVKIHVGKFIQSVSIIAFGDGDAQRKAKNLYPNCKIISAKLKK